MKRQKMIIKPANKTEKGTPVFLKHPYNSSHGLIWRVDSKGDQWVKKTDGNFNQFGEWIKL